MPVSILILTLNEEINLPRCLESLSWSDDIVVLDSYSSDRTVEIARAAGARVIQRHFDDWSSHQNWAVSNIRFSNPWVYYTDADEVVSAELADEIASVTNDSSRSEVAYRMRRKDMFYGRWLRHSSMYPIWLTRLFRPEKIRWERLINPVAVVDGIEGTLNGHIIHHSFNKGLSAWIAKHNQYAMLEAEECLKSLRTGSVDYKALLTSSDPVNRRKALKTLSFRLPCRPLLRFLYMYFLRMGILDGWAGLTYCRLLAVYEYLIVLNIRELKRREMGLPV